MKLTKRTYGIAGAVAVLGAAVLAVSLAGCQQVEFLMYLFQPPTNVEAVYVPPKDKKILVLVEDRLHPTTYEPMKFALTEDINRRLKDANIAAATVPYDRIADLSISTPNYSNLSISQVGQRLGADLVLYVQIESLQLKEGTVWHGHFDTSVWFIDAHDGARLWPKDQPPGVGYMLPIVELPPSDDSSTNMGDEITKKLSKEMAIAIVDLFRSRTIQPGHEKQAPENPVDEFK